MTERGRSVEVRVRDMQADMELDVSGPVPILWLRPGLLPAASVAHLGIAMDDFVAWIRATVAD